MITSQNEAIKQETSDRYHLAAIVESAEDAIISKGLDGIVRSWNPSAERIFGYAASEMIGQSILRIIPKDREAEEEMILSRVHAGEHVRHFATIRQRKNGELVPISLTVSPVRNAAGCIIGVSKIARDITVERRLQAEQDKLVAELQHAVDEIKVLRSLIPICAHCKKIRDDSGYWQQLEKYFDEHGHFRFSHGICPECVQKHYGDFLPKNRNA